MIGVVASCVFALNKWHLVFHEGVRFTKT